MSAKHHSHDPWTILSLPEALIEYILAEFLTIVDRLRLQRVCHTFKEVVNAFPEKKLRLSMDKVLRRPGNQIVMDQSYDVLNVKRILQRPMMNSLLSLRIDLDVVCFDPQGIRYHDYFDLPYKMDIRLGHLKSLHISSTHRYYSRPSSTAISKLVHVGGSTLDTLTLENINNIGGRLMDQIVTDTFISHLKFLHSTLTDTGRLKMYRFLMGEAPPRMRSVILRDVPNLMEMFWSNATYNHHRFSFSTPLDLLDFGEACRVLTERQLEEINKATHKFVLPAYEWRRIEYYKKMLPNVEIVNEQS